MIKKTFFLSLLKKKNKLERFSLANLAFLKPVL
jgi:hypothetical protein